MLEEYEKLAASADGSPSSGLPLPLRADQPPARLAPRRRRDRQRYIDAINCVSISCRIRRRRESVATAARPAHNSRPPSPPPRRSFVICSSYTVYIYTYIQKWFFISQVLSVPTHLVLSDVDQFDTILDMEKDELAPEIEEEEEGEIEYVEGDDIEMGDMDDMEDFEGFGDEDGKHFPCFY
ncbi:hypothetical protein ZWY2020_004098 [Hordeum vulgare]|nr:hypothetical protein ZWY2020_004098 [Hordeum vulgare]